MLFQYLKFTFTIICLSLFFKSSWGADLKKEDNTFQILLEETDDDKKIDLLITKASELRKESLNEAIIYYKYALELADNPKHLKQALYIAYQLADIFKLSNSYHYAQKYYRKYEEIALALKSDKNRAVAYYYQGEINLFQKNNKEAELYFIKAIEIFEKLASYSELSACFNSLGLLFQKSDLTKSYAYYEKAFKLEQTDSSRQNCGLYLNNMACIHIYKGELTKAKLKLDSAFLMANKNNNITTLAYIQSSYGEYYQAKKQYNLAKDAYLTSLNFHKQHSNYEVVHQVNLLLSELYNEMEQYKLALSYFKQHKKIQDSIQKISNIKQFQKQEFEENLRQLEHKIKGEFQNKKRNDLVIKLITIGIFIILLLILGISLFKKKVEMKKIQLSKENKSLKESLLLEKIETKNKELISKVILLGERNDLIKNVSEKLNLCKPKLKKSNIDIIQEIINELNSNVNEKQWEDFQRNFNNLHPEFYKNLLQDFPNLSPKDLKICSLLKLNMSSKEIAQISHMTTNSVEVSRSRLRKKLKLSSSTISLFVFLSKY